MHEITATRPDGSGIEDRFRVTARGDCRHTATVPNPDNPGGTITYDDLLPGRWRDVEAAGWDGAGLWARGTGPEGEPVAALWARSLGRWQPATPAGPGRARRG